jgi:hypothetical protein
MLTYLYYTVINTKTKQFCEVGKYLVHERLS